jgi:hypothetical protein
MQEFHYELPNICAVQINSHFNVFLSELTAFKTADL